LDIGQKLLSAEHPHTLIRWESSKYILLTGKLKAEKLCVQVLDIEKKLLGAEHPHTLTRWESGKYILSTGKLNNAEQLCVQVLDTRNKLLSAEHLEILIISMGDLASTYCYQGKLKVAEQLEV
jgi:tetratricopeptide repeat protein